MTFSLVTGCTGKAADVYSSPEGDSVPRSAGVRMLANEHRIGAHSAPARGGAGRRGPARDRAGVWGRAPLEEGEEHEVEAGRSRACASVCVRRHERTGLRTGGADGHFD